MQIKEKDESYHDKIFNSDYTGNINKNGYNWLVIVRDCQFFQVSVTQHDALIYFSSNPTIYMTGLTFVDCKVKKHLIQLNSKSTSISHICLSNLQKKC